MLTIIPSQDPHTIAVEFEGKAVKEDLVKIDKEIQTRFRDKEQFNVYAVIHEVDGVTAKALIEDAKLDVKRWSQYNKLAVVSDRNWLEKMTGLGDILPGVEAKHFPMAEAEKAWAWLKTD